MKRGPLDFHLADRTGLVKGARLFSNLVSPPIMGAVLGLAGGLVTRPGWEGFAWGALYGLLVSLTPILFVVYMLRTGRIQELHMTNTRERHLPYLVGVISSVVAFGLVRLFSGPGVLGCLALFNALQLSALGVINVRWLISFHASAMMATLLVANMLIGPVSLLITGPLLLLVSATRLYLRRHTLAQIIAGILLGAISVWAILSAGCSFG